MEVKKNPKANLEQLKQIFILSGLVVSLGIMVMAFNWKSNTAQAEDLGNVEVQLDDELAEVTRKQELPPPPPPEPQQQQKAEIIKIVDDNTETDDVDLDTEADDDTEIEIVDDIEEDEEVVETVFVTVEKMPEFPGGELAMRRYIGKNINYPAVARENDIQGTVYLRFVVLRNGKVGDVQLLRGVDQLLDDEAIRVVKSLPKFEPGMQGGKKVKVWFSVPINFKLN